MSTWPLYFGPLALGVSRWDKTSHCVASFLLTTWMAALLEEGLLQGEVVAAGGAALSRAVAAQPLSAMCRSSSPRAVAVGQTRESHGSVCLEGKVG